MRTPSFVSWLILQLLVMLTDIGGTRGKRTHKKSKGMSEIKIKIKHGDSEMST